MMTEKTAIYRHFDGDSALLYIGLSRNPLRRWEQHKAHALWFYEIARIEIEWFDSRGEAAHAEVEAIRKERPIFNTIYNRSQAAPKKRVVPDPHVGVPVDVERQAPPPVALSDILVGLALPDDHVSIGELIGAGVPPDNIKDGSRRVVIDSLLKMIPPGGTLVVADGVRITEDQAEDARSRKIAVRLIM